MAIKVSLINMKGGVGKSTLAVNLAWQFAADTGGWEKRVLLVDLDPQFNASQYLLASVYHEIYTQMHRQFRIYLNNLQELLEFRAMSPLIQLFVTFRYVKGKLFCRLDLIPSRLELSETLRQGKRSLRRSRR